MKFTHRLYYSPKDAHQPAALICLYRFYKQQDKDCAIPNWMKWLKFRDKWMTKMESIHGKRNLTCVICGKSGLIPRSKSRSNLATIDHIKPVSKFPELRFEESNLQITCYKCNQKKSNN